MAFTPRVLDGLAAGGAFMKLTGVKRGTCLNTVWRAFGSPKSDGLNNGYPWASDALKGARANGALRTGKIADAPPGAVLYWSNVMGTWNRNGKRVYGDAGHVGIKGHNGFWTIDASGDGSLDFVANDRLAKKWPHVKFEGYAYGPGAFLGHAVAVAVAAGGSSTPFDNEVATVPAIIDKKDMTMRYFWAPIRGGMVTTEASGVFAPANAEEAECLSKAYNGIDVTTREWDVLRQAALNRQAVANKLIAAALPAAKAASDSAVDVSAIRAEARAGAEEALAKLTLTAKVS